MENRLDIAHEYGDKFRVSVSHDDFSSWAPSLKFQTHCVVDLKFFPYDIQTCYITFLSIVYSIDSAGATIRFVNPQVRDLS